MKVFTAAFTETFENRWSASLILCRIISVRALGLISSQGLIFTVRSYFFSQSLHHKKKKNKSVILKKNVFLALHRISAFFPIEPNSQLSQPDVADTVKSFLKTQKKKKEVTQVVLNKHLISYLVLKIYFWHISIKFCGFNNIKCDCIWVLTFSVCVPIGYLMKRYTAEVSKHAAVYNTAILLIISA